MYKIIGNDGKTYGPVAAEKIREWIAQGRVDNRTSVLVEGAADWTFAGLLPEFAKEFSGPPPVIVPPRMAPPPGRRTNGYATAGFVCGLLSWACCCGCPFNILGLIFSIVALAQIHSQVEKQEGWGLALAGLICSAVSLLFSFGLGML
ncbi:MAG TPA: DUF4190 domain-containing protein, partial [Verrucomicrobiae bacterium]